MKIILLKIYLMPIFGEIFSLILKYLYLKFHYMKVINMKKVNLQ